MFGAFFRALILSGVGLSFLTGLGSSGFCETTAAFFLGDVVLALRFTKELWCFWGALNPYTLVFHDACCLPRQKRQPVGPIQVDLVCP